MTFCRFPRLVNLACSVMLLCSVPFITTELSSAAPKAAPAAKAKTAAPAAVKPVPAKPVAAPVAYSPIEVNELLKTPSKFMNKHVQFEGTFSSFSTLGLDYKKAMRDSKDYISFLIRRPDVTHHTIPLAELKLIYPRKKAESVMELEAGDQVKIQGTVFSTALEEPWLDVDEISVVKKINPDKPKKAASHSVMEDEE